MKRENSENNGIILEKQHIIFIVFLFLFIIIFFFIFGLSLNSCSTTKRDASLQNVITENSGDISINIDPNTSDRLQSGSEQTNKLKEIKIPGYPKIEISANTKNSIGWFFNPEDNPCYFQFEHVLEENNEMIFKSAYVPPGKSINTATLTKSLKKSEYPAVLKITTASLETYAPMNGANNKTLLVVK